MSISSSTHPAQFVVCGTALRGKRAPKALKKYFGIGMAPFDAKTPWRIPVDELPPLLSETPSRRWTQYKESSSEAESSNNVPILPSIRFLASGEETNNAPWVNWGADIVAVCVFLEDRVTTEKRLQQVRACVISFASPRSLGQPLPSCVILTLTLHRVCRHSRNFITIPKLWLWASDCNRSSPLTWV